MEIDTIYRNGDERLPIQDKISSHLEKDVKQMNSSQYGTPGENVEMEKFNYGYAPTPDAYEVDFVWKNITVKSPPTTKGCFKKTTIPSKIILDDVNGRVKGGECLAILGSTGAGKTTLLNYLSYKIETTNLTVTGDILLNNKPINSDKFNLISSYVMQDDVLEPLMTPTEILLFTAKLRLTLPQEELEQRVLNMMKTLNLMKCKDTRIGDVFTRGVSGGERKRTSIAVELITDPKVIFLDEPTTGLDSYNAFEVVSLLKKLSTQGKIVIFTIHHPASEIFPLVDKVCVLGLGKTIYFGTGSKCFQAFEHMGIPVPHRENPFQHFMEVTTVMCVKDAKILNAYPELKNIENVQERYESYISSLSEHFNEKKDEYKDDSKILEGFSSNMDEYLKERSVKNGFIYESAMLFARNNVNSIRNPKNLVMKIMQYFIIGFLFSIIYEPLSREASGVQDRLGIIILCSIIFILTASNNQTLVFYSEKKVFLRERSNKLYSVFSYYMAKFINDIPIYFCSACIYASILYWSIFMNDTYIGILLLSAFGGITYAFVIGSFVNHQEALVVANTSFNIPLLVMSGFFAAATNFAPYLIPLKYLSFYKYSFQLLINNEFTDQQPFYCFDSDPDTCAPLANRFTFLEPVYVSFIGIVVVMIFLNIIGFILLYKLAKIRV